MTIHKVDQHTLSKHDQIELALLGFLCVGIMLLGLIWA